MMDHGTFILCTNVHGKISVQTDQSCWRHLYGVETLLGAAGFPVGDFMNWRRHLCPDISRHFPTIPDFSRWWDLAGNLGASSGEGLYMGVNLPRPLWQGWSFSPEIVTSPIYFLLPHSVKISAQTDQNTIFDLCPPRNFPNRNCIPL